MVLDLGLRWVMRGIVARFVDGTIGEDGLVTLSFVYRGVRVSGRKWTIYCAGIGMPLADVERELHQSVQSAVDDCAKHG